MICSKCRDKDHLACASADCTCGHSDSPVRALSDVERQAVRNGTLTGAVMPRESVNGAGDGS